MKFKDSSLESDLPTSLNYQVMTTTIVNSLLPVGARLQTFWTTWKSLVAHPSIVNILKHGHVLPFRKKPQLITSCSVKSGYKAADRPFGTNSKTPSQEGHRAGAQTSFKGFQRPTFHCAQEISQFLTSDRSLSSQQILHNQEILNGDTRIY